MRDDAVTESIAHFIGFFSIMEEQARLRAEYDRFKADKAAAAERTLLDAESHRHNAPMDPRGYDPDLGFRAPPPQPPADVPVAPLTAPPLLPAELLYTSQMLDLAEPEIVPPLMNSNTTYNLSPPSSMAAVVIQKNTLADNDVVGATAEVGQLAKAAMEAEMSAIQGLAAVLSPIHLSLADLAGDWPGLVTTIVQSTTALADRVATLDGAITTTADTGEVTTHVAIAGGTLGVSFATDSAAQGVHVDGERIEELPEWQDFLPDFLQEEEEEDAETADADDAEIHATGDDDTIATGGEATDGVAEVGQDTSGIEETDDGEGAGDPADAAHDYTQDFEDGAPGADVDFDPGHHVVTGANQLVNEATIYSTWLDAKMFVVGGKYVKLDAISQTNVIVETDSAPAGVAAPKGGIGEPGAGPSEAHNLAQVETISRKEYDKQKAEEAAAKEAEKAAAKAGDGDTDPPAAGTDGEPLLSSDAAPADDVPMAGDDSTASDATTDDAGSDTGADIGADPAPAPSVPPMSFPTNWAMTTIDGDLIQYNWSQQFNFVSDADTVMFGFTGSNTTLGTGENLSINDLFAWELGFQFDLIIVGGDMIDVTLVKQTNVLLDSDKFEVVHAPIAPAGTAMAAAPQAAAAQDASETATAAVEQTAAAAVNVAGQPGQDATIALVSANDDEPVADMAQSDAPPPAAPEDLVPITASGPESTHQSTQAAPQPAPALSPAPAAGIKTSMADNMLVNQAKITTVGQDVVQELDATAASLLDDFAAQKANVSADLMARQEFAGTDLLKVLHITKDFKTVNMVEQTNVLGDKDHLTLALDEFAAGLKEEMEVTMGSNALANLALVKDTGIDSTVMARGEVYSDALLHQAELVMPDMPDMPDLAAAQAALATEAVAFLSDDMIVKPAMEAMKADMHAQMDMTLPSSDIMQTMLA